MNRASLVFAATLVCVGSAAGSALAQATQAPPLTPILAGKKFVAPLKGLATVDITQPVTKREKENVVTRIQVKNTSAGPIARLTVDETWYDNAGASGNIVVGGKGTINGLLQPGEVQTLIIQTPYNAKMKANQWKFSHANGDVKPNRVAKITAEGDAKEPAKTAAKAPAKKK